MKISTCQYKYFEKCVNTDRNVSMRIYRRLPFKKFLLKEQNQKAYGSNILADQRLVFVEK